MSKARSTSPWRAWDCGRWRRDSRFWVLPTRSACDASSLCTTRSTLMRSNAQYEPSYKSFSFRWRTQMKSASMLITAFTLTAGVMLAGARQGTSGGLNTAAIDKALGLPGQMQGDVYRVGMPRTDLAVTVHGIKVKPGLALGSWAGFRKSGAQAVVHGDLVLTEAEINPVISKLFDAGLQITALHNHLIDEAPHVMYLHYWGQGPEATLATALKAALATTKTPLTAASATTTQPDPGFEANAMQKPIGKPCTYATARSALSAHRPEKIMMMGIELPPARGMATAINVQSAGGGKVAATGDFVM